MLMPKFVIAVHGGAGPGSDFIKRSVQTLCKLRVTPWLI